MKRLGASAPKAVSKRAQHASGSRGRWFTAALLVVCLVAAALAAVAPSAAGADPVPASLDAYRAAVLADSPYAYLGLNDSSGTVATDLSGNGRTGVFVGSPSRTQEGPFGPGSNAVSLAGSGQYVDMNRTLVPTTGNWTVEAWVWSGGAGFGDGDPIWSQYHNSFSTRTTAQVNVSSGAVGLQIGSASVAPTNQIPLNTWRHVAWRRAGTTLSVLVDGELAGSFTTSTSVDGKETWIGGHQGTYSTAYFNGRLAEFSVFRSALTDTQINAHYEAAVPSVPLGPGTPAGYKAAVLSSAPDAYYPLDEAAGSIAVDQTGVRNASIVGTIQLGAEGPFGPGSRSMSFTGPGQRVQAPEALVPGTGDWTVEAWIAVHGDGFGDGNPVWSQYLTAANTRTTAQVAGSAAPYTVVVQVGEPTGSPAGALGQDEWEYVVWRKTSAMIQIIVGGQVVASVPAAGNVDPKVTWIGAHSATGYSTAGFNGRISQFAVYERAVTNAELASHWRAAGRTPVEPFAGGRPGDELAALQARAAEVAASCPTPPSGTTSLEVTIDVVAGVCSISGEAQVCQWVQWFCDHRNQLILGIAGTAVVLLAAPLVAAAGSSLATAWPSISGWSTTFTAADLTAMYGPGAVGTSAGPMILAGASLTITGADLVLVGTAVGIPLTIAGVGTWLLNYSVSHGATGGSETGDLGDDWVQRPADQIQTSSDCWDCAIDIEERLGGGEIHTIYPSESTGAQYLPEYRGYDGEWINHRVVEYNGRVYDAFGPRTGTPTAEWKALWDGFDEGIINWGGL